ncbi:hypothetical protein ACXJJ3_38190 [Kribbella sp. WER1]
MTPLVLKLRSRLGSGLQALGARLAPAARPAAEPEVPAKPAESASVDRGDVHADALNQMRTAVNWLIGALAAVAAAMIAGSQLSSIGKLSWTADHSRLLAALIGVTAAVAAILIAIGLLYYTQAPINTDFARLTKLAKNDRRWGLNGPLRKQVAGDSTLHRGKDTLQNLKTAFESVRIEYHRLKDAAYDAELKLATTPDEQTRAGAATLNAQRVVVESRLQEYRNALQRVARVDKYLRTRRRYRVTTAIVILFSVAAAFGFVAFAWAANPADRQQDAVQQRAVAATLTLTDAGRKDLERQLGTACATAATASGVPVIALTSSGAGVEVVLVPGTACPQPVRLTVSSSDGAVTR